MKKIIPFLLLLTILNLCADTLPNSFDLRDINGKNYINDVKNQGQYGTCYAFGTASAAEGSYNYTMDLHDEDRASFSESFIIWSLGQNYDGFPALDKGDGGWPTYDSMEAMVDYGIISDSTFSYSSEIMDNYIADQTKHELNYYWDEPKVRFSNWHRITSNDIETMKQALINFGTLKAGVYVNSTDFYEYTDTDGVFTDTYNETTNDFEHLSDINHAISLVGWTDSDAWILRNSWGEDWGNDGYMYIDYLSAGVSLASAYLTYLPWSEYGFDDINITNTSDITASTQNTGYQMVSRGIYEWGDDNSSVNNQATITATATSTDEFTFVHGIYFWAGDESSITNSGTITAEANSTGNQATAYGIMLQGTAINNTGTIDAKAFTSDGSRATAYGIKHFSFDENSNLINSGSISSAATNENGWAYGIQALDVELVQNDGNITALSNGTSQGIVSEGQRYGNSTVINNGNILSTSNIYSSGISTYYADIINNNNIQATATDSDSQSYGIYAYTWIDMYENIKVDVTNNGDITVASKSKAFGIYGSNIQSITNSGTIDVTATDSYAVGIYANGVENIINTGTITASSTNGDAYGLYLNNSTASNNGTVNGMTVLLNDSVLGGNGTFNGNVSVYSSTVAPGNSVGTLTINGDYTQDENSILSIEISNSDSDKLIISGSADIDGSTLEIIPTEYITNASYTSFIQSSSLSGKFATVESPLVINTFFTQASGDLSLDITRNSYESLASNSSQQSVGEALESLRSIASSDMQSILDTFDNYYDLDTFQESLSDLSANLYTSTSYATLENLNVLNTNINEYLQNTNYLNDKEIHSWGKFLTSTSKVKPQNDILGFNQRMNGVMLGFDKKIQDNFTLGIASSLTKQNLTEKTSSGESEMNSYYAHIYAKYDLQNWFFTSILSYAHVNVESLRDIESFDTVAKSKYSDTVYALSSQVGYDFKWDDVTLTPSLGLLYSSLHNEAIDESGAGDISLHVNGFDRTSLKSTLGLELSKLQKENNAYSKLSLHVKWIHEYLNENDNLHVKFIESGASFKTTSRDSYENQAVIGASLKMGFNKNISLTISGNSILATNSTKEYLVGANLKFVF